MADAPAANTSPPPATPSPPPSRPRLYLFILPFVPILLAVGVGLALRHHTPSPPPPATTATASVEIGDLAPDFALDNALADADAPPVTLSGLLKKSPVLLVFHRGFGCPHCVSYLSEFPNWIDDFKDAGLQVVAIGPDIPVAVLDSLDAYQLDLHFPLLCDPEDQVATAYNLLDDDGTFFYGIFIIDQQRRIHYAMRTHIPVDAFPDFIQEGRKLQKP